MLEQIINFLEQADFFISLFAVVVIVVGFVIAAARYTIRFHKIKPEKDFVQFKIDLGKALMLGLEILVLSDVIETIIVPPTYQTLGGFALLVILRTFVSWTLSLEVEGHWPWQQEKDQNNA